MRSAKGSRIPGAVVVVVAGFRGGDGGAAGLVKGTGPGALERVTGVEPASPAWKAGALPLSYTRTVDGTVAAGAGARELGSRR